METGLEFHHFEGKDEKTNVYKYKTRIPVFGRRSSQLQWLRKNWARIPLFGRTRSKFQCLYK